MKVLTGSDKQTTFLGLTDPLLTPGTADISAKEAGLSWRVFVTDGRG